jgi:carboxymethylenebutenolidase
MVRAMRALALTALLVACGSKNAPAPAPEPTPTADPTAERIAGTGPISEEEFKAMHELRAETPPAAEGQDIEVGGAKAYLSLPKGATAPVPGIVVIHEWWGLNDNIRHWSDRLAALGYAALAVDLYSGTVATTPDEAMAAMKTVKTEDAKRVISAAVDFLKNDARVKAPQEAVIGWCFGGGWSLETAMDHPELDAAVIYYGQLDTDPANLKKIKAHLLGIFANQDKGIPPAEVDKFETALKEAGVDATIKRYDADHAFANPSGPRYDQEDAAAAWQELVDFLRATMPPQATGPT